MIQVQRFNKALKSAWSLLGFSHSWMSFSFYNIYYGLPGLETKVFDGTLPQILVLFSLCYFACTISRGIILHRRGVRADQVVQHSLLNMFISYCCPWLLSHWQISVNTPILFLSFLSVVHPLPYLLPADFPFLPLNIQKKKKKKNGRQLTHGSLYGKYRKYDGTFYHEMTNDPTSGYRVIGYFDSVPNKNFPASCPYSGQARRNHRLLETASCGAALLQSSILDGQLHSAGHQLLRKQSGTFLQCAQCAQLPSPPHELRSDRRCAYPAVASKSLSAVLKTGW